MTAHDPRVTLTEAEVERIVACLPSGSVVRHDLLAVVGSVVAARLAPIRALAEDWAETIGSDLDLLDIETKEDAERFGFRSMRRLAGKRLRAALDAPVSASQDHDWHQPLTHCHCGRVIPCRHHDGAEGQGEGR